MIPPASLHTLRSGLLFAALALMTPLSTAAEPEAPPPEAAPVTLTWTQLLALPLPPPVERSTYGSAPQQFGELRLPAGEPPAQGWPVAVLLHGGCWLNKYDYAYFTRLAAALGEVGVATWTLEYRRLGDDGGGWPGSFLDAGTGTDHLRSLAASQRLDLARVVAAGHSAGGQLALWLAARGKLPNVSELYTPEPLPLLGVVGIAAITDLVSYRVGKPESCNASVDQLLGGTAEEQPQRYAQASPLARLPLGVPQWLISGALDKVVPLAGVSAYATAARDAGDHVALVVDAAAGHYEPADPGSAIGQQVIAAIRKALGLR